MYLFPQIFWKKAKGKNFYFHLIRRKLKKRDLKHWVESTVHEFRFRHI